METIESDSNESIQCDEENMVHAIESGHALYELNGDVVDVGRPGCVPIIYSL